jgi:hypothetical protein
MRIRHGALFLLASIESACGARTELESPHAPVVPHVDAAVADAPPDSPPTRHVVSIGATYSAHFATMSDDTFYFWGDIQLGGIVSPRRPQLSPLPPGTRAVGGSQDEFCHIDSAGNLFVTSPRDLPFPGRRIDAPPMSEFAHGTPHWCGVALSRDGVLYDYLRATRARAIETSVRLRRFGTGPIQLLGIDVEGNVYGVGFREPRDAVRLRTPFRATEIFGHCILSDAGEVACVGEIRSDGLPDENSLTSEFVVIPSVRDVVEVIPYPDSFVTVQAPS